MLANPLLSGPPILSAGEETIRSPCRLFLPSPASSRGVQPGARRNSFTRSRIRANRSLSTATSASWKMILTVPSLIREVVVPDDRLLRWSPHRPRPGEARSPSPGHRCRGAGWRSGSHAPPGTSLALCHRYRRERATVWNGPDLKLINIEPAVFFLRYGGE